MKKLFLALILVASCSDELDVKLERTIDHYNLRPLAVRQFENDPKYVLGQALFFDNVLSGNRDTSCATCHLWNRGSSDALPVSIGTNGKGLGENRIITNGFEIEHPRNSLDLWNRDNNSVKALFWDGRVEMMDPEKRIFRTPMGDYLPSGLDNTLAVQAVFPFVRKDEMLGTYGSKSALDLPNGHANKVNELVVKKEFSSEKERVQSAHKQIVRRLIGTGQLEVWQKKYRELIKAAFPDALFEDVTIAHIANAIAHFEELAFATRSTAWDQYLDGDIQAINDDAKKGALIFYGKGKCASCHSGALMSDFNYHNLGIPDFGPGMDGSGRDYGRFNVTGLEEDKYRFRTPPLRNVSETAPYFHNGFIQSLKAAIQHHNDVNFYVDKYRDDGGFMLRPDQISSITPILNEGLNLSEEEINHLESFLNSLVSKLDKKTFDKVMVDEVPSGLPVHRLAEEPKYLWD